MSPRMSLSEALRTLQAPRQGRVASIDGLRAVAVLSVLVYHVDSQWLPGGAIGVDVFFVISGFVITRLLLTRRPRLTKFYRDRWTRLMPALFSMVFIVCLLIATRGGKYKLDIEHAPLALTYTMNLYRDVNPRFNGGLFAHTWSLGVEEQFYLAWPLILSRLRPGAWRIRILVGVCVLVSGERLLLAARGQGAWIANGPDTRLDQLLAGCLLAIALHEGKLHDRALRRLKALAPLAAIGLGVLARLATRSLLEASLDLTVSAVLTGTLLASLATTPAAPLSRVLALKPLVAVGTLSYSIYLWHYPVVQLLSGHGLNNSETLILALIASLALAFGSWWLVETRFHRQVSFAAIPQEAHHTDRSGPLPAATTELSHDV